MRAVLIILLTILLGFQLWMIHGLTRYKSEMHALTEQTVTELPAGSSEPKARAKRQQIVAGSTRRSVQTSAGIDTASCPEIDIYSRIALGTAWSDWQAERGSTIGGTYQRPYADADPEAVAELSEANVPAAMIQHGWNLFWQATRASGDRFMGRASGQLPVDLKQPDWGLLMDALTLMEQAAALDQEFAFVDIAMELHRVRRSAKQNDWLSQEQLQTLRSRSAAYGEMPETLYDELHDNYVEGRVFDDTRREAEQ